MNPIIFALRHPITVMVAMAGIVAGSWLALTRMKVDIFPQLNLPVIYVCQPYSGMDPGQMEGLLTNYYEYHFLYISGIHHVESKNIQGLALMKLYFHPGTDMAQAMAETIQYVNRSRAFMPPGTVGPFVMRFDVGSVPVGYLVLSSDNPNRTIGEIQDKGLFKVRPMFASLPGVSAPPPFGGSARAIVVRADPDRLRAYKVSPDEVVAAITSGNTISPSGNIRVKDRMPIVPANAMVVNPQDLGKLPIRPGSNVYIRDLATIEDSTDTTVGYALVNGRRAVYILVTKRAEASTLDVVNEVKKNLPKMQAALDADGVPDVKVSMEFDQSPYVTGAMWGVAMESLLGAALTGLMVLVFLRDWRTVIVVVLNIPLALLGAIIALWLTGQTINLMTLGGLALAVGILVDEATVEVENIHTQFEHTPSIARAVRLGNAETAVPRLLAMLCILAVFLPSFFMQGAARALFVPLALAVGFAMVTSYLLSSTFVPVLSVWLLRHQHATTESSFFTRLRNRYTAVVRRAVQLRWGLIAGYVVAAAAIIWLVGGQVGREIFPTVDAHQFQLRLRAPTGTRIERTEEITVKALDIIKQKVGAENVEISLGYVGVVASSFPINGVYQWMCGPEEAVIRVALRKGSGIGTEALKNQLRDELPKKLADWLHPKLIAEGFNTEQVEERLQGIKLSFEPSDIVNGVMSFGSPTPVEVVVSGPNYADSRKLAARISKELATIASLRDLQYGQPLDYPTVAVNIDRELAGRSGVTVEDVSKSLVAATASSRFTVPNYWRDPKSGIGYQVQVEIPIDRMNSPKEVGLVPIRQQAVSGERNGGVLLQDIARIEEGTTPGEYDRYNMKRIISMTANIYGDDLGDVARQIDQTIQRVNESLWVADKDAQGKQGWKNELSGEFVAETNKPSRPPRGIQVDVRGQIEPMNDMFRGLTVGLGMAVFVIFLLLTAYFQSLKLALVVITTAPAVVAGVALALFVTGTTLNIQSFMGAIMAIGVATANTEGSTTRVASVAAASPPMTARPSGATCWPPSPSASAIGTMPAIMAQLVIKIGRSRARPASTPASPAAAPSVRCRSANVTSRIALATATPMAMIAPMNDWMLSVVRVASSISATPATTAGIVVSTMSACRSD